MDELINNTEFIANIASKMEVMLVQPLQKRIEAMEDEINTMKKEISAIKHSIKSMEHNTAHTIKESEIKLTIDMKEMKEDLVTTMKDLLAPFPIGKKTNKMRRQNKRRQKN